MDGYSHSAWRARCLSLVSSRWKQGMVGSGVAGFKRTKRQEGKGATRKQMARRECFWEIIKVDHSPPTPTLIMYTG
jgi:hypothetical protein